MTHTFVCFHCNEHIMIDGIISVDGFWTCAGQLESVSTEHTHLLHWMLQLQLRWSGNNKLHVGGRNVACLPICVSVVIECWPVQGGPPFPLSGPDPGQVEEIEGVMEDSVYLCLPQRRLWLWGSVQSSTDWKVESQRVQSKYPWARNWT